MNKLIYIILLTLPCLAFGIVHRVIQDGSGDYTLIQAALDACNPGDTVLVYPGRYYENLIIQTNDVSLISLEAITGSEVYIDSTIVDGTMQSPTLSIYVNRQNISVRGLSFTNGKGTGIGIAQTSTTLTNCKIYGCIASSGGGLIIAGSTVHLSGVKIFNNYALILGGGLFASTGTGYVNNITFDPVNRCSIYNNRSGSGQDIYIQNAYSDLTIYLDTFSVIEPTTYYAIYRSEGLNNYVMQIDILNAHHQEIDSDLYVSPEGDDANDGLSPAASLKTIHEAIYRIAADSLSQNTVHLLPGTYSRADNDQVFPIALKSWTIVQGSGMDNTEVVGSPHPLIPVGYGSTDTVFQTYCQPVVKLANLSVTTQNTNNDTVIMGVKSGSLNLSYFRIHDVNPNWTASIQVWLNNLEDSIWDNLIIENIDASERGAISVYQGTIYGAMSGKITNSIFRNLTSTYTSASVWADPLVQIIGDKHLSIENCIVSNLSMADDNSSVFVVGGIQFPQQSNQFSLTNCLFMNNSSQNDMITLASPNNPIIKISNCTFAGNEGDAYTLQVKGNVSITNSVFDNDTPYQVKVMPISGTDNASTLNIEHSFIKDGYAGIQQAAGNTINYSVSNITGNPLFLGGDDIHNPLYYSLALGSPCINSGTPDTLGLNLLPYDLAGNQRVWDGRIDMGAFEFDSEPYVGIDDPTTPALQNGLLSAYPNPFSAFTNLKVILPVTQNKSLSGISTASIDIYNIRGQKVKSISLDATKATEQYAYWDGTDSIGRKCSTGVYLLNLTVNGKRYNLRKATLIK